MPSRRSRRRRVPKNKPRVSTGLLAVILIMIVIVIVAVVVWSMSGSNEDDRVDNGTGLDRVLLSTSMGDIVIELFDDMPITTGNFRNLVEERRYDGTTFHRVVSDFVIQGGADPSAQTISDEKMDLHKNEKGTVAMAKVPNQPNSASSQFYINLKHNVNLDGFYSVFGRVVEGMDVVESIGRVETIGEEPVVPIIISTARLIE